MQPAVGALHGFDESDDMDREAAAPEPDARGFALDVGLIPFSIAENAFFPQPPSQGIGIIDLGLLLMSRWNRAEFTLPASSTSQSSVNLRAPLSTREPHFGFPCDAAPLPISMAIHRYRRPRSGVRSVEVSGRFGPQDNDSRR
jgi:hypothetical protein